MSKPQLTEAELLDLVSEDLETEAGDDGIGAYEYFGARGTDRRPYVEVTTGSVVVDVTDYAHAGEDDLPAYVHGYAYHEDEECGFTLCFRTLTEDENGRVFALYAVDPD